MKKTLLFCLTALSAAAAAQAADVFVCRNPDLTVAVSKARGGTFAYTSWKAAGSRSRPDLRLAGGRESVEGTGACRHRQWTFRNGSYAYTVAQGGCHAGDVPDYAGAVMVERNGRQISHFYCRAAFR